HIGEELHLNCDRSVSLADFAAATRDVERKMPGAEAALLRLGQRSEQFADRIKRLDICHGVRSRCATDRRLIYEYGFLDVMVSREALPCSCGACPVPIRRLLFRLRQGAIKHLMQQSRLA